MTYTRKTISALGGLEKHTASLDGASATALEFIQFWAVRYGCLKPVPAVVIRRALRLLATHLSCLIDPGVVRAEMIAFEQAGRGDGTARTLTEARARIEAHLDAPGSQPMNSWLDALHSKEERARSAATLESLEKHFPPRERNRNGWRCRVDGAGPHPGVARPVKGTR